MGEPDCIFCKIVAGEIPAAKLLETEDVLSFMDIGPLSEGHALVIPKSHYVNVSDCPPETVAKVASCLGTIAKAIINVTSCEGYNVLCNNGKAAGQAVFHLHFHIIPRYKGDGLFKWNALTYPEGRMEQLATAIREQL